MIFATMNIPKKIASFLIFLLVIQATGSSQDHILYFLENSPQSNFLNPARLTDRSKVFINLPLLAGQSFSFTNSFSFHDLGVIENNHLKIDVGNFYNQIPEKNYLSENMVLPLLVFQLRTKRRIFSFNISENQILRTRFDASLVKLIDKGNYEFINQPFSTNFDFNFLHYRKYALGYSQIINGKWSIGGNLKILTGFSAVDVIRSNIGIETGSNLEQITITTDGEYNFCLPFRVDQNENRAPSRFNSLHYFTNASNLGLAFDAGVRYQLLPKLELSASLIDLGYIHWKNPVENVSHHGSFTWKGIDLANYLNTDPTEEDYNHSTSAKGILDSIRNLISLTSNSNPFNTPIPTKVFLGASYTICPVLKAGLLDQLLFYDSQISNALTLSGNLQLGQIFSLSAGYTLTNKSFKNLALGTLLKLGPLEVYFATDNLLALNLADSKSLNFQCGINLLFGKND